MKILDHKMWMVLLFALIVGIDQVTKAQAESWGWTIHSNPGLLLQSFADISATIRIVFVTTLYGWIVFGFFLIQWMLIPRLLDLRLGLTMVLAGVTGNTLDRALNGQVRDFLNFNGSSLVFNVADIFLSLGAAWVVFSLILHRDQVWHPDSRRRSILIDPQYQLRTALFNMGLASAGMLVFFLFSFTFLRHIAAAQFPHATLIYVITAVPIVVLVLLVVFAMTIWLTHRTVGPLYALEKYIDRLMIDPNLSVDFRLRKTDEHSNLIRIARKIRGIAVKTQNAKKSDH